jgi:hypothetical protein
MEKGPAILLVVDTQTSSAWRSSRWNAKAIVIGQRADSRLESAQRVLAEAV